MTIFTCWPGKPAWAQGTMGAVPDPISSRELDDYTNRLGLSRQQRQAVEAMHDHYRVEFAQLRERDIEKFINDNRGMGGGPMAGLGMLTDRKAVEKSLKDLTDIHAKIRAIDNRLFDQMQSVLTEEQLAKLPLARQARERARYRSGLSRLTAFMNPAAQVDLSDFIADLKLSPPEREALEPRLMQYESTLTSAARKLFESTNTTMLDALDALDKQMSAAGGAVNEQTMRDPERRGQMFQAIRSIMGDVQRQLGARAGELSDLNRRSLRTMAAALLPENARVLRDQFYQRAYPELGAGHRGAGSASRAFDLVAKFKDPALSDEQRQSVAILTGEFYANLDRLAEQAMDAIDENRKSQSFFDFDQESRRKFQDQLAALREKRTKLNENAVASLRAALSTELIEHLDKRLADGGSEVVLAEGQVITMVGGAGGVVPGAVSVTRFERGTTSDVTDASAMIDPFVPGAISKLDLQTYARRMNLDEDGKTVLTGLHEDYLEKFRVVEASEIKSVRDAERQLWAMDQSSGQLRPRTPQAIDDLYSLRRKALDAVIAIDRLFFDDVQVALGDDDAAIVSRLRASRQRQVLLRAGGGSGGMFAGMPATRGGDRAGSRAGGGAFRMMGAGFGGGGGEASVDLAAVVESLNLTAAASADKSEFELALSEYEHAALSAFQKLYDSNLRMGAARDKLMAQSMRVESDRETRTIQIGEGARAMLENEGRAAGEARQTVTVLNKSTLARLIAALPPAEAHQLRRSYNQRAFPGVFHDPSAAEPHLQAALQLSTLSESQRTQVQELAMDYRGQYEQICEKLVALEASAPDMGGGPLGGRGGGGAIDWQTVQEQMRQREKLDFDRNDLNDKTVARLRGLLNEQQAQELALDRVSQ